MSRRPAAKLHVHVPGLQSVEIPVRRNVLTLGRDRTCGITLQSPYVSRLHARIEKRGDGHVVIDEGSRNRTLVNGREVTGPTRLDHGDQISIANVDIWYMLDVALNLPTPPWPAKPRREPTKAGLQLSVDESTHRVWIEDRKFDVPLSPLEFEFLRFLCSRGGAVCTREEIGAAVWGEGAYDYDMLYRLVQRVKEKVEADPSQPRYIMSCRGIGYAVSC